MHLPRFSFIDPVVQGVGDLLYPQADDDLDTVFPEFEDALCPGRLQFILVQQVRVPQLQAQAGGAVIQRQDIPAAAETVEQRPSAAPATRSSLSAGACFSSSSSSSVSSCPGVGSRNARISTRKHR